MVSREESVKELLRISNLGERLVQKELKAVIEDMEQEARELLDEWMFSDPNSVGNSQAALTLGKYAKKLRELLDE